MVKIEAVLHPEEAEVVWTMINHAATAGCDLTCDSTLAQPHRAGRQRRDRGRFEHGRVPRREPRQRSEREREPDRPRARAAPDDRKTAALERLHAARRRTPRRVS
jgi:hypothetical protein